MAVRLLVATHNPIATVILRSTSLGGVRYNTTQHPDWRILPGLLFPVVQPPIIIRPRRNVPAARAPEAAIARLVLLLFMIGSYYNVTTLPSPLHCPASEWSQKKLYALTKPQLLLHVCRKSYYVLIFVLLFNVCFKYRRDCLAAVAAVTS